MVRAQARQVDWKPTWLPAGRPSGMAEAVLFHAGGQLIARGWPIGCSTCRPLLRSLRDLEEGKTRGAVCFARHVTALLREALKLKADKPHLPEEAFTARAVGLQARLDASIDERRRCRGAAFSLAGPGSPMAGQGIVHRTEDWLGGAAMMCAMT